jgi:hypothetical protein
MKIFLIFILASMMLISGHNVQQETKKVFLHPIENKIQIGPMVKNRNLTFGVKNIVLESLQEFDYTLSESIENSDYSLKIEILYFDVIQTNTGISVFHKNDNETVLRLKGTLYNKDGKKIKDYLSIGKSSEISMSTILISEGGSINQQSVSNVIKKSSETLIQNLFIKK